MFFAVATSFLRFGLIPTPGSDAWCPNRLSQCKREQLVGNLALLKKVRHAPGVVENVLFVLDGLLAISLEGVCDDRSPAASAPYVQVLSMEMYLSHR